MRESLDSVTDFYALLGVAPGACAGEIKSAYRAMVRLTHPDSNGGNGHEESFKRIRRAYETLSDPHARAAYDLTMGLTTARGEGGFYRFRFENFFDKLLDSVKMEWWRERVGQTQEEAP